MKVWLYQEVNYGVVAEIAGDSVCNEEIFKNAEDAAEHMLDAVGENLKEDYVLDERLPTVEELVKELDDRDSACIEMFLHYAGNYDAYFSICVKGMEVLC